MLNEITVSYTGSGNGDNVDKIRKKVTNLFNKLSGNYRVNASIYGNNQVFLDGALWMNNGEDIKPRFTKYDNVLHIETRSLTKTLLTDKPSVNKQNLIDVANTLIGFKIGCIGEINIRKSHKFICISGKFSVT